jgi:hypothetical protein
MNKCLKGSARILIMLVSLSCLFLPLSQTGTPFASATPTGAGGSKFSTASPSSSQLAPTGTGGSQFPMTSPNPGLPAPTNTPTTIYLNRTGPHVVFSGQSGIWLTNPDGSFPTLLSLYAIMVTADLRRAISPAGDRMALVVQNDQGLNLVMVDIPTGSEETIAHLISITRAEETTDPTGPKAVATYAIRDYNSVAWQPGDGRLLVFIGANDGPSADLYQYDTVTKQITRLTSGPSQSVLPSWSPDGLYIMNYGVSWVPPFGGGIGPANQLDGIWAVRVSDGKVITLPKPRYIYPRFDAWSIGWQDSSHYLTFDEINGCYQNLRSVDVTSGASTPIMDYGFDSQIARSPENGAFLFASGSAGCSGSLGPGTFLFVPGQSSLTNPPQTAPVKLLDKAAYQIEWMPDSGVFLAYPEALFSPDGKTRYDPPVYDKSFEPAVSKAGYQAWEVIENQRGRVMVKVPGGDWQTIMNGSVKQLIWDSINGSILLIALDDGSLYAASYPDFTPRLMGNLGGGVDQAFWLP